MGLQNGSQECRYNMRALNVYTHYILRILNFWKAFKDFCSPRTFTPDVARSETPADCATGRKLSSAAQLHRPPCQESWHHARAVDCAVSIAAAGGIVASRFGRRA